MQKRLSRADYMVTLLFIFMLALAVGAFFYGINVGVDRTNAKYEENNQKIAAKPQLYGAYHQQYLVSFYHTIYLPYRDFQKKWFEVMDSLDLNSSSIDPASLMNGLSKLASEKYNSARNGIMPDSSPLLVDAQNNYLKSLQLFSDASKRFQSRVNSIISGKVTEEIQKDAYFHEAKRFALQAQNQYYEAIVKWNESISPTVKGSNLIKNNNPSIKEWNDAGLIVKNDIVSAMLAKEMYFTAYQPQDAVLRVDDLIKNGQAKNLNFTNVNQIVNMLVSSEGIRQGDYIKGKDKFYLNETLPQLPFFFEQN